VTRFSVGLPQLDADPGSIAPYAARAEELGFEGLWVLDSAVGGPTGHSTTLDGLQLLAHAAAVTRSPRLGIAVIVITRRNPALLAKELASLDRLSGGRLTVGVGIGSSQPPPPEFNFAGGPRARLLREGVEMMRALWTDSFEAGRVEPKPLQQPLPVWFGGSAEPALRRAARMADGWIGGGSSSTEDFIGHVRILREAAPDGFPIAKRVYIAVEDSERRARERLTPVLDGMYGWPGITDRVAVCGPPQQCAEELHRLVAGGAQELVLNPLYDHERQLEACAAVAGLTAAARPGRARRGASGR
jgi:alkanesulfonate monooxygenase SsuD/methylene tetrahydromethanopterin reductase-like flavin-dependent oxidoreductase (luciferase family)